MSQAALAQPLPRSAATRVGVVILNYHSTDDTLAALASLLAGDCLDLSVIVADNTSGEQADPALAAQLPSRVRYLPTGGNLGYAAGNNLAIAEHLAAGVRYVLLLNPDARVEPDTLGRLVATADRNPQAGFVGPRLLDGDRPGRIVQSDGGRIDWGRGAAPVHLHVHSPADTLGEGVAEVDYVTGSCVLISRRTLEDVGLLPEEYFLYFEETDLSVRARRRGWLSLVDRAALARHHRRSTGEVPSLAYLYYLTRNRGIFATRYLDDPAAFDRAYADLDRRFLAPWRKRVAAAAPELLDDFDKVVAMAKNDASRGLTGESAELHSFRRQGVAGWSS